MSMEKRSDSSEEITPQQESAPKSPCKPGKQKSVFLYIMILFTVAFGLILLSFFMHQRSNQQVLGELHNNVTALEQLQDALDENLRLERELKKARDLAQSLESQLDVDQSQDSATAAALLLLYQLQQQYAARDLDSCAKTIEALEAGPAKSLPQEDLSEIIVSPARRYGQLKTAVKDLLSAAEK